MRAWITSEPLCSICIRTLHSPAQMSNNNQDGKTRTNEHHDQRKPGPRGKRARDSLILTPEERLKSISLIHNLDSSSNAEFLVICGMVGTSGSRVK